MGFFSKLFGPSAAEIERQNEERKQKRAQVLARRRAEFADMVEAIPVAPVVVVPGGKLERRALSEMPEVKYASVTKSFNRDRLPSFVVIDVETNGLKVQGGRILELSAIRYEDFQPVASWSTLVNPGKAIPADATEVNGITDDIVAAAPALGSVAQSFIDFIGSSVLVGYNLPFDLKFLFSRGIDLVSQRRKYYDVLELARKAYKNDELYSFSLADVAEHCDIWPDLAHRSLSDCYTTGLVFENCIDNITGVY